MNPTIFWKLPFVLRGTEASSRYPSK